MEILLPRIDYTHEIVNTHEGALLQERALGACPGSETLRVYWPERNNKQQENKGEATCTSRVPQTICSSYIAEIKLLFFDNLSSLLEQTL